MVLGGGYMSKRVPISFKEEELETKLWNFLQEQSKIIGASAYLKQLLYEKMIENEKSTKK